MSTHSQLPTLNSQPPPADYGAYAPQDGAYASSQPSQFRLGRLLQFLKSFWWLPLLTFVLASGAAAAYVLYLAQPTYTSIGTLWETEKLRLPDGAAFTGDVQNYYGTQMELLQSPRLQLLALQRLEAATTNGIPKDKDGKPLAAKIKAGQRPKSTVLFIQSSSPNPDFSEAFLNSLMNEFVSYKKNVRKTVSGDTLSSISEQVLRLERDLKIDQQTLNAFTRTNNLAILQEEATTSGGYLARLKTQLSDLELEARLLDATAAGQTNTLSGTNASPFPIDPLRLTSSSASAAVGESYAAFRELELLKIKRAKLSRYLKDKHPKIVRIDSDIDRGQKIAELYRNQSRDQLASARQAVGMKLESVRASIKEWEAKVVDFKAIIAEAERLRQNVGRSQGLYDRLVLMLQNVDISRNIDQDTLAVLEPASPAIRDRKQDIMMVGAASFAGLGLGVGLIFLIQLRDDRFLAASEVTDKFGDAILGQVPEIKGIKKAKIAGLLTDDEYTRELGESYRNLRSALLYFPVQHERPKVILITSPVPSEGKSTIAINLARTFAQGGARVLLIDADLRKGHLHETLGLQKEPGLSDLLQNGTTDIRNYIQQVSNLKSELPNSSAAPAPLAPSPGDASAQPPPAAPSSAPAQPPSDPQLSAFIPHPRSRTSDLRPLTSSPGGPRSQRPRLDFLSRGANIKHPGDALLSPEWDRALARWREQYDFVIIDSPPVFAADDASTLAPKADGTLVVVRRRYSKAGVTKEALELLAQRQAKLLGLVFNRADASSHSYYYYKYPEYNHSEEAKT